MPKEIYIRSENPWWSMDWREFWLYRELLYVLAWRDVKIRYKQTALGVMWVFLQPLVTTGIFTVIFGKIAHIPSDNLPYPLFIFIGITIWNFFSSGLTMAANSLIANTAIINKIYFPRLIIPISSVLTASFDFIISLVLVSIAIIYFQFSPGVIGLIVIPFILLILLLTICGLGFFTAAFNIKYRDVRYALPFAIQTLFYATPIIYPLSALFDYRRIILSLNPLSAVVESTRAVVSNSPINWNLNFLDFAIACLIFTFGLWYFRHTESYFADLA